MQDLIAKASTLLEALPYIQRFSGATFVINRTTVEMTWYPPSSDELDDD